MLPSDAPALSVILVAPHDFLHIQKTIRHLRAQTCANQIELVIATPEPAALEKEARIWNEFHSVQIISVRTITSASRAKADAFLYTHAPFVAYAEDHAFPSPNWANALLKAYAQPYAAVSVEMRNANPSSISRADMLLNFGPWIAPAERGCQRMLPGHNTGYRREVLNMSPEQLEATMDSEAVFHLELSRRGERLFLATDASVAHLNFSTWRPFLLHKLNGGRMFGARRAAENNWSVPRRVLYAASAPLIPLVRLRKMLPDLKRTGALTPFDPTLILSLALGLLTHALGEATGYLFGIGNAREKYAQLELYRADQLHNEERHLAFE